VFDLVIIMYKKNQLLIMQELFELKQMVKELRNDIAELKNQANPYRRVIPNEPQPFIPEKNRRPPFNPYKREDMPYYRSE
jgi:hypothetical protein